MALRSAFARLFGGPQAMQATTLRHFSIPTVYDSMYGTTYGSPPTCFDRAHFTGCSSR